MNDSFDSWNLVITEGPDRGRSYPLNSKSKLLIGRGSDSDTQIRDPRLSRIHCELTREGNDWVLLDRGGSGGTIVDGVRMDGPCTLSNGSTFTIGESQLRLQLENPLDSPTLVPTQSATPDLFQANDSDPLQANQTSNPFEPQPVAQDAPEQLAEITQLEGETFLRFRLDKLIATGQNSVMFKGIDTKHERPVAVKILRPQMTSTDDQRERFIRAMQTMSPISHPNIVRTRKAGRTGQYCWAAFDWVEGTSVAQLIEKFGIGGMLEWKEVWRVAVDIGRALEEASRHEIVHRNVTPSNLLRRNSDKSFLLTDLIFARALEYTDAQSLTRPGDVIGDLGYMAPERIFDSTCVDARSDQYSLGATLYTLMTGQPPYVADSIGELVQKIRDEEPKRPNKFQMSLDERFCDLVMQMIDKSMDARYATPTELILDLKRVGNLAGMSID